MPFRVLFVCTGNVCRSPAAELIFAQRAAGHDIASASAGTNGLTGRHVDQPTALALREIGIDPSPHTARRLTPGLVRAADLVLTADVAHRGFAVREVPEAFRRAFTLREFARLGADLPPLPGRATPQLLRERVIDVAEQRGHVDPVGPEEENIADPFGASVDVARETVATIDSVVTAVSLVMGLQAAPTVDPVV